MKAVESWGDVEDTMQNASEQASCAYLYPNQDPMPRQIKCPSRPMALLLGSYWFMDSAGRSLEPL